jgi:SAM-dependent MidA family methyltransferase
MKKLLFILLFLAVAGGAIGYYLWNKPHASVTNQKADFVLTAPELLEDFQKDENAANARYLGKIVQVSGTILELVPGTGLQMQVVLETGDMMSRISCVLKEDHKAFLERKLEKGDPVTIKGFCTGIAMDVVLDRCVIVES